MTPYIKVVTFHFVANREHWAITGWSDDVVWFEETRKNGQEDCHMYCEARKIEGKWVLDECSRETIESYSYGGEIEAIEAFFNEHGMPEPSNA